MNNFIYRDSYWKISLNNCFKIFSFNIIHYQIITAMFYKIILYNRHIWMSQIMKEFCFFFERFYHILLICRIGVITQHFLYCTGLIQKPSVYGFINSTHTAGFYHSFDFISSVQDYTFTDEAALGSDYYFFTAFLAKTCFIAIIMSAFFTKKHTKILSFLILLN
ncbi:MAG: hypothetical protein BWY64_03524 [bacterium ADurb.Bin363]|nr:MAG: hypothetical protein BWY64_03524 [bacterium ADurb.Bin363]